MGEADDREEDDPGDDQQDPDSEHRAHGESLSLRPISA
jgi:hypothetical protein